MSGVFGWNDNKDDYGYSGDDSDYKSAIRKHKDPDDDGYAPKSQKTKPASNNNDDHYDDNDSKAFRDFNDFVCKQNLPVPTAKHYLVSTASNVIIVVSDMTGSMGRWPGEIFKRLPLLYDRASKYLETDDLEILFIAHGDARTDEYPIQATFFGRGKELDEYLASFKNCDGGGQGTESHELVAYFLEKHVNLSCAQNVYTFFLTDEAACDSVSARHVDEHLGDRNVDPKLKKTKNLFRVLKRKMQVFTILCKTNYYDPEPIKNWWKSTIGMENVVPLSDSRRVVDVMLAVMAKIVGQLGVFESDLADRQLGMPHGEENMETVMSSVCLIGKGTPSSPFALPDGVHDKDKIALPPPDKTRSLLDFDDD